MVKIVETVINEIRFPNNSIEQNIYTSEDFTFRKIYKNGEMANIGWFEIYLKKGNERIKVFEVKESICDISFRRKELEIKDGFYDKIDIQ